MKRMEKPNYPIMFKQNLIRENKNQEALKDYLLINVAEGRGCMEVNDITYPLHQGETYLVNRQKRVQFKTEETLQLFFIRISEKAVEEYLFRNKSYAPKKSHPNSVVMMPQHLLINAFFSGVESGVDNDYRASMPLVFLKMQECIGILTCVLPELYDWFYQMNRIQKIDLHEFMEAHFKENLPLEQFAIASGRSLSTFRREFIKEFGMTPQRWLLKRRLQEAHHLITQFHKSPSAFLYDLGFESFPHFSRNFKSIYGIQPSMLLKNGSGE